MVLTCFLAQVALVVSLALILSDSPPFAPLLCLNTWNLSFMWFYMVSGFAVPVQTTPSLKYVSCPLPSFHMSNLTTLLSSYGILEHGALGADDFIYLVSDAFGTVSVIDASSDAQAVQALHGIASKLNEGHLMPWRCIANGEPHRLPTLSSSSVLVGCRYTSK
jgi:hypothetical protein